MEDALCARQELARDREGAVAVGHQRVFTPRRGAETFGNTENEDRVNIETRREASRTEEHTLAEPANSVSDLVELGLDRIDELREGGFGPNGVEAAQPSEHVTDSMERVDFACGPTVARSQQAARQIVGPPSEAPPRTRARLGRK